MKTRGFAGTYVPSLVVALSALLPATASAGTYAVKSCADGVSRDVSAWVPSTRAGEPIDQVRNCQGTNGGSDGDVNFAQSFGFRPTHPAPSGNAGAATGRVAGVTLTAPVGSTIKSITYHRRLQSKDPAWEVKLTGSTTAQPLDDCVTATLGVDCPDSAVGGLVTRTLPAGTTSLDLAAYCIAASCTYDDGPAYTFAAAVYGATVTIQDDTPPTVAAPTVTGLSDGWFGPNSRLTLAASDVTGIPSLQAAEGNALLTSTQARACPEGSVVACAEPTLGYGPLRSTDVISTGLKISDGLHSVVTRATDVAGNTKDSDPLSINVDLTPPTPLKVGGSNRIVPDEYQPLTWELPTGGSPIVNARVQVCTDDGTSDGGCVWNSAPLAGPFSVHLPAGESEAEVVVELTDQAGNVATSGDKYFQRDAVAPPPPSAIKAFGGTGAARNFVVTISDSLEDSDIAWIQPRLCQGTACKDLDRVLFVYGTTTTISITPPAPGNYRAEASLVDFTGNVGLPASTDFTYGASVAGPIVLGTGIGGAKGADGQSGKLIALTPILPAKLNGSSLLVRGTTVAGSAAQVSVSITGRHTNGKAVTIAKEAKLAPNGKFAVRLTLPAKLNRKSGVLITIAATPNAGFTAAKVRKRLTA